MLKWHHHFTGKSNPCLQINLDLVDTFNHCFQGHFHILKNNVVIVPVAELDSCQYSVILQWLV